MMNRLGSGFYPRDAVLARYLLVAISTHSCASLSVCLSQVRVSAIEAVERIELVLARRFPSTFLH